MVMLWCSICFYSNKSYVNIRIPFCVLVKKMVACSNCRSAKCLNALISSAIKTFVVDKLGHMSLFFGHYLAGFYYLKKDSYRIYRRENVGQKH